MQGIKEYLLGVIGAAILCCIVTQFAGKEGILGTTLKLLTGVFMLIVLVAPVTDIRIRPMNIFSDITADADQITSTAAMRSISSGGQPWRVETVTERETRGEMASI